MYVLIKDHKFLGVPGKKGLGEYLYMKPIFRQGPENPRFIFQGLLKFIHIIWSIFHMLRQSESD